MLLLEEEWSDAEALEDSECGECEVCSSGEVEEALLVSEVDEDES